MVRNQLANLEFVEAAGALSIAASTFLGGLMVGSRRSQSRIKELEGKVNVDSLTGLYNRGAFDESLEREVARLDRYPDLKPSTLLLADIDHFKKVNDARGHEGGDQVLVQTAAVLKDRLRSTDLAFRWGGEEFAVIAPRTDLAGALALAEEIRVQFAATTGETMSIGIAEVGDAADQSLRKADYALYKAKESGRDRVEFAHPG